MVKLIWTMPESKPSFAAQNRFVCIMAAYCDFRDKSAHMGHFPKDGENVQNVACFLSFTVIKWFDFNLNALVRRNLQRWTGFD